MCKRLFLLFCLVFVLGPIGEVSAYFGDDFESYRNTGTEPYEPNDLRYIWDPNGATATWYYLDMDYMHGGIKSLEIWYDNSFTPYYCGVSRTDAPYDWTLGGIAAGLSLWYRGSPNIDEMYVRLTDSSNRETIVKYGDMFDANDLELEQWQQWDIKLRYFIENNGDFDMTAVRTLEIGVGDPIVQSPGVPGGGQVYFDDIALYKCVYQSEIDLNGDCVIDWFDFYILGEDWLDDSGSSDNSKMRRLWDLGSL